MSEDAGSWLIAIGCLIFGIRMAWKSQQEQRARLDPPRTDQWHFPGWVLAESSENTHLWHNETIGLYIALEEGDTEVRVVVMDTMGQVVIERMTFDRNRPKAAIATEVQDAVADVADWII
jgi:hypothetical protein